MPFHLILLWYLFLVTTMGSRKGSLLESNIKQMLEYAGFRPELHKIIKGYEIDIYLQVGKNKVAFECKQYEKSRLTIRNLIHEWDSKNKELELDKIILVIFGELPSKSDFQLAKKYGLILWDEKTFLRLFNLATEKKKGSTLLILDEMGLSRPAGPSEDIQSIKKSEIYLLLQEMKQSATSKLEGEITDGNVDMDISINGTDKVVRIEYSADKDFFTIYIPCDKTVKTTKPHFPFFDIELLRYTIIRYEPDQDLMKKIADLTGSLGLKRKKQEPEYIYIKNQPRMDVVELFYWMVKSLGEMEWEIGQYPRCFYRADYLELPHDAKVERYKDTPVIPICALHFNWGVAKPAMFLDTVIRDFWGVGAGYSFRVLVNPP